MQFHPGSNRFPHCFRIASRFRFVLPALTLAVVAIPVHASTFNAFSDFSSTNPSGDWSYLYWFPDNLFVDPNLPDLGGYSSNLTLAESYGPPGTCLAGTECWLGLANGFLRNNLDVPADFGVIVVEGQTLSLFAAGLAVVRFTAPMDKLYEFSGFFDGDSNQPRSTRRAIVANGDIGAALFDATGVLAFDEREGFLFQLPLAAGETVDFLVGESVFDLRFGDIAIGFDATVQPVPEPATLLVFACGLAALWRLRRKG